MASASLAPSMQGSTPRHTKHGSASLALTMDSPEAPLCCRHANLLTSSKHPAFPPGGPAASAPFLCSYGVCVCQQLLIFCCYEHGTLLSSCTCLATPTHVNSMHFLHVQSSRQRHAQYQAVPSAACPCIAASAHSSALAALHLCIAALLVADEHEGGALHAANAAHNGGVIQACPVSMQLHKFVSDVQDDVEAGGAVRVTGHLQALHRCEPAVRLLAQLRAAGRCGRRSAD